MVLSLPLIISQTFHRYLECCEQLAHWIHLSSIVTLQLFRSARISRPSSSASLCGMKDELTDSMVDCDFQILPPPFDDPIPKRVPLVGSVTVSCRTELYHDLLHIHRFSSRPSRLQFRDLNNFRSSIEMFEQSLENTIRLLYFLCSVVEELLADWTSWSPPYVPLETLSLTKRQYSVLFSMRNDIRLSILQYILGLDERWSLEATVASCTFVKKCIEYHYRDLVNLTVPSLLRISSNKSRIFPSSTVNLLALALPDDVLSLNCQILYSLAEDGVGISFLRSLLQDSHQHILLFLQDSYGYLFGAFLSFVPHQLSTILPEKSFLFRALPDFKIFPLTSRLVPPLTDVLLTRRREEAYAPWLSSSGIHIGLLPCLSSSSPSSTASAILYLDPSFSFGHTSLPDPAMTHETLSLGEEFKCHLFEVWAFTGA